MSKLFRQVEVVALELASLHVRRPSNPRIRLILTFLNRIGAKSVVWGDSYRYSAIQRRIPLKDGGRIHFAVCKEGLRHHHDRQDPDRCLSDFFSFWDEMEPPLDEGLIPFAVIEEHVASGKTAPELYEFLEWIEGSRK